MGRSFAEVSLTAAPELSKPAQFFHRKTGRRYRVFRKPGEFLIEESFANKDLGLAYSDPRRVSYAIGSGNHARSFLVERPGRLYEAPIAFFTRAGRWDMSPGYDTESYVGFTREVTENCLFCHSGRGNTGDTSIGCERCHGPGERHLARPGGAIVSPAKLSTDLRDQVCEQCHLFGAARVTQPGRSPADYRPGEPLSAVLAVYDYDGSAASTPTVTGHSPEMKQSLCRRKSRNKLWCGSCHEVHAKARSVAIPVFYRAKCLNCHTRQACSRSPDPASPEHRENNCVGCHMPKRPVRESAHVTFTDHRILRRPETDRRTHSEGFKLRAILPSELDDPVVATRNLGFAYAALASSTGRKEFHRKVVDILRPLEGTKVADAAFWQTLAEAHLSLDENARAEEAFRMTTGLDPSAASALYGLGYVFQLSGRLPDAIQAYLGALEADPFKAEALGNLAAAYSDIGQREKAVEALKAALKLEPGNLRWRAIQLSGRSGYRK
jgi:tetratricopeptide (TPR) repeat protein